MVRLRIVLAGLLVLGPLVLPHTLRAQERSSAEQRLRALQDQITLDVIRLSEAEEMERTTLSTLDDLNRQIALRSELINTNQELLEQLRQRQDSIETSMRSLENELGHLKSEYHQRATHAYKYGRLHDIALILAAQSINQMLIRVRYLGRFADQRRERLDEITSATERITRQREEMTNARTQAEELIVQYQSEQEELQGLQSKRREVIAELKAQRSTIELELEDRQREAERLETQIRRMITAETDRRARSTPDPADAALSSAFSSLRGDLPWPTQGVVTEPFGEIENPVHGTLTSNPGIVLATSPSAEVNAVYDGEVVEVNLMPEFGRLVMISHGEYTSLYGNLSLLYVSTGSQVTAGQVIGRAGTENEPKGAALFFALFEDGLEIDPVPWLSAR